MVSINIAIQFLIFFIFKFLNLGFLGSSMRITVVATPNLMIGNEVNIQLNVRLNFVIFVTVIRGLAVKYCNQLNEKQTK